MKGLVLFSLLICFAITPLRAKPSSSGELVDLFKRIWGDLRYKSCRCDQKSDGNHEFGEEYSAELRDQRSYDAAPQEAGMRTKRCRCDEDDDSGSVNSQEIRSLPFGNRLPDADFKTNGYKRNRLQGGDETSLQKVTKNGRVGQGTEDPCREFRQLLPGAVPLEMLDDYLQSADENGDGALDKAEMKLFAMSVEVLKQCNNWG